MAKFSELDRRHAMKLLLAAGAASGVAGCIDKPEADAGAKKTPTQKPSRKLLSVQEMALLTALSGTIIPATDTPGAVEAEVPETIRDLLKNWGADDLRTYWFDGLASIDSYFKEASGGQPFEFLDASARLKALSVFDAAVYSGEIDNPFYKNAKSTIATAYYMSEIGADEELIYDPVPGDFKGCIPFEDVGRAWAT